MAATAVMEAVITEEGMEATAGDMLTEAIGGATAAGVEAIMAAPTTMAARITTTMDTMAAHIIITALRMDSRSVLAAITAVITGTVTGIGSISAAASIHASARRSKFSVIFCTRSSTPCGRFQCDHGSMWPGGELIA